MGYPKSRFWVFKVSWRKSNMNKKPYFIHFWPNFCHIWWYFKVNLIWQKIKINLLQFSFNPFMDDSGYPLKNFFATQSITIIVWSKSKFPDLERIGAIVIFKMFIDFWIIFAICQITFNLPGDSELRKIKLNTKLS